jgi:alpha-glucosidase
MTDWFPHAVGYEVYVRSFADSNGDGMGDLEGIRRRLDHLDWLGVNVVWLTPFYPSPGFDCGYDVSGYVDVDPQHGDLAAFDALLEDAHARGMRLLVDIVPNHTSHLHPWFVESRSSVESPLRDLYIWRDPGADGGPPNNWVSHFGGPAWTLDETTGQYYLHLFLPEQPDLNWESDEVRGRIDEVFRFWCERGVDGFRVDVAHALVKHPAFPDNPVLRTPAPDAGPWEVFASFDHRYDLDQDGNVELHRRWRAVVDPYGAVLIGEIGVAAPQRLTRYSTSGGLHGVFYIEPANLGWEPARIIDAVRRVHELDPDGVAWAMDSHDARRSASRFGGGDRGAARSLAATTLLFGLGGIPFLYQGQELGLEDGVVDAADLVDPVATRNQGVPGRDGARTGMPWEPGPHDGFTSGEPWLRYLPRDASETVVVQRTDPGSWAARHRDLAATRRRLADHWSAPPRWLDSPSPQVGAVRRGDAAVVANLGAEPAHVDLGDGTWQTAFASAEGVSVDGSAVTLPEETAVIVERVGATSAADPP